MKNIEYIMINGVKLCVSIRTKNESHPILFYLHGGPGDAALPLVTKYNHQLEDIYTVVVLEQRGAGKSYYPFTEKIYLDTFIDDIHELILIILKRFSQEKLYLVGHSWGSVLGLKFIQLYPDLIHAYIGCGQVVNMLKSSQIAYDYALNENKRLANTKIVNKLQSIDCSYRSDTWLHDLLFVTGQVVRLKGSLYGKSNYNQFVFDFLLSRDYRLKDTLNRQKGSLQSIKFLWQELMSINFEHITAFEVPVVFIEGRHDHHVSSTLTHSYYETIESKKQFTWFEKSCHFPQWSEPEKFYETLKLLRNDN